MEKYYAEFNFKDGSFVYVVKSEIEEAANKIANNEVAVLKIHNIKTGDVFEKEISNNRYLKRYLQVDQNGWVSFEDMKSLEELNDSEHEIFLKNGLD